MMLSIDTFKTELTNENIQFGTHGKTWIASVPIIPINEN